MSHNQSLSTEEAPKLDRGLTLLPALLNVFYYRETLFIVYEVSRLP